MQSLREKFIEIASNKTIVIGLILFLLILFLVIGLGVFKSKDRWAYNPPYEKIDLNVVNFGQVYSGQKSLIYIPKEGQSVGIGLGVEKNNKQIMLNAVLKDVNASIKLKRKDNRLLYKNVYDGVDVEYLVYDGHIKENIIIKNPKSQREFVFDLKKNFPNNVEIGMRTENGIFVHFYNKINGEELFSLDMPYARDDVGKIIPYHYRLENNKLYLEIHNKKRWDDSVVYPVVLDPPMTVREYDEVLVKVGQNGDSPNNLKDGDVAEIKAKGWPWGKYEKRDYVIVRVPKMSEEERKKFLQKVESEKVEPQAKLLQEGASQAELEKNKQKKEFNRQIAGAVYYGIDYMSFLNNEKVKAIKVGDDYSESGVSKNGLEKVIRNRLEENPVLDASQLSLQEIFQQKDWAEQVTAFKKDCDSVKITYIRDESVIDSHKRLAKRVQEKESFLSNVWYKIVKKVKAATVNTYSIGTSSRDYSTIQAWENARDGNLSSNDYVEKGECYNDSTFTAGVTIDGSTTDSDNYMWLTVAEGERHNGTAGSGVKIDVSSAGDVVVVQDSYTIVGWLEIDDYGSTSGNNAAVFLNASSISNCTVRNNIIHDNIYWAGSLGIYDYSSNGSHSIYNNFLYAGTQEAATDYAIAGYWSNAGSNVYNNTIYNFDYGIVADTTDDILAKNNLVLSCVTNDFATNSGTFDSNSDYNISSDTTAPGSNSLTSKTTADNLVSTTAGSEDLHLKNINADAYNAGTSISTTFTNDIDNNTRAIDDSWDIGADEFGVDEGNWWEATFTKCKNVNIKNASTTELTNYPAYVDVTYDSDMQSDFDDIRFTTNECGDGGSLLDYEIESHTASTDADVWVQVPSIPASGTSTIAMYYASSTAISAENMEGVWDDGFVFVQHLQEDPSGSDPQGIDSTSYSNDCSNDGSLESGDLISGKVDGALEFDGGTNDRYMCGTDSSVNFGSDTDFTIEAWYKTSTSDGGPDPMVSKIDTGNSPYQGYQLFNSWGNLRFYLRDVNNAEVYSQISNVADGNWHYGVGVADRDGNMELYNDAVRGDQDSLSSIADIDDEHELMVGSNPNYNYNFVGDLDEVRISNVVRSAKWIEQNYNMIENQSSYVTFDSEETYNEPPTISSASDSPDPVNVGADVTFSVDWDDNESDNVKVKICKTDSLTNQNCDGGYWATSTSFTADDPEEVSYTAQSGDSGTQNFYAFVCDTNGGCSDSDSGTFTVYSAPTISSVSDSPDPVDPGNSITFSLNWNDADAGENVKVKICKTDSLTNQNCDGGYWATSTAFTTDDPEEVSYTTETADIGTQDYYAFVCDDDANCSSSNSGSFVINDPDAMKTFRVTEYYLTSGDFTGATYDLTLDQDLEDDYFVLIRGSKVSDGGSNPDNDYIRVYEVPGGTGDLGDSGGNDVISLSRYVADYDWEGVVTVVECLGGTTSSGFKLLDIVETSISASSVSGTSTSTTGWSDINQVVLFGGFKGGGVEWEEAAGAAQDGNAGQTRLYPTSTSTLNWERESTTELDAVTMTTFVIEWGSEWTVQHTNVSGSNYGGGCDAEAEYNTGSIDSVARDNTWLWATGISDGYGIGDSASGAVITLGNGVDQNASETSVAWCGEYEHTRDFDIYTMTHTDLANDYRFKTDGDTDVLDLEVTVDSATDGYRMGWVTNTCSGSGNAHPRDRFWARYTADTTVTISRGYDGQAFVAWVQGADFSGVTYAMNATPSVSSVSDSPDPLGVGHNVGFSVDWTDDDVPDELVKVLICKTDSLTDGSCDGGTWAWSGVYTDRDPDVVYYETQETDKGSQNYYAFVCDDDGECSSSSSGSFTVENQTPDAPSGLQVEGQENGAINITDQTPEFSFIYEDSLDDGDVADTYCVEVNTQSDFAGTSMWVADSSSCYSGSAIGSNVNESNRTPNFTYAGDTLNLDGTRYYWRVWLWDDDGERSATSSVGWFQMADTSSGAGVRLKGGRLKGGIRLK